MSKYDAEYGYIPDDEDYDYRIDQETGGGYDARPSGQDVIQDAMRNPNIRPTYPLPPGKAWTFNGSEGRWQATNDNTNQGSRGLDYWASQGVKPEDIFDATGQPKAGWRRTANGYERVENNAGGGGGGDDDYGGGGYGGGGGDYGGYAPPPRAALPALDYPEFQAPVFNAPAPFSYDEYDAPDPFSYESFDAPDPFSYKEYDAPDPFSYEAYKMPTVEEIGQEPGFDFALKQGIKAFENSKAYTGTFASGATSKGLNDYANGMAFQNADRVIGRSAENYDRNRANAFGSWDANRVSGLDEYSTNRNNAFSTYDSNYKVKADSYDRNRNNAFGTWDANRASGLDTYNTNRNNAADTYATNYGVSRDVFDRNYQGALDEYKPKARARELEYGRDFDMYAYEGDDAYRRWKAMVDANSV